MDFMDFMGGPTVEMINPDRFLVGFPLASVGCADGGIRRVKQASRQVDMQRVRAADGSQGKQLNTCEAYKTSDEIRDQALHGKCGGTP